MPANGAHKPRKICDTNILRCILLNINEHYDTTYEYYMIDERRFSVLLEALLKNGIVSRISLSKPSSTKDFAITDVEKYNIWSKSGFYRAIEKYILPVLGLIK